MAETRNSIRYQASHFYDENRMNKAFISHSISNCFAQKCTSETCLVPLAWIMFFAAYWQTQKHLQAKLLQSEIAM